MLIALSSAEYISEYFDKVPSSEFHTINDQNLMVWTPTGTITMRPENWTLTVRS